MLAMLKGGGHKKFWGSFYVVACSHIEGGRNKFPFYKTAAQTSSGPGIYQFCSPHPPLN